MCNKNHNHMKYGSLRYRVRQTKVFVTLRHFLLFYLPNNVENQNFENLKKTPGDVIILHICDKNHNHMKYG